MNPKELRGLYEAYSEVYAPREEEIDEAVKGESSERRMDLAGERKAGHRPLSKKEGERYASHKLSQMAYVQRKRMGEELEIDEAMSSYEKNRQRAAQRAAARNAARDSGQTGNVPGVGYVSPRREKETWTDEGGKERHKTGARMPQKEEFDVFDVVLEFLQVEGYAETLEEAEWLMANVIDEEAIDIILGEEQLDEISQKTATRAYAQSYTGEFEGKDDAKDVKRTDNLRKHIERKFGDKAAQDADRHADSETFGRKDPRTGKRQPKPESRFQNANKYRTRSDGKMHGQDQNKLKAKLKRRIGEEYMDEAQEARNNPEKYEREQSKKSAPVRGERTPMPPRGDKRREDFEKWYAANVR